MNPFWMIKASFKQYKLISIAFVILVACSSLFSIFISLQEKSFRQSSARVSNQFDLIIGAAGSKTDLLLATAFLEQKQLKLMSAETVQKITSDPKFEYAAPISFGDHYKHFPIIGTIPAFADDLSDHKLMQGKMFDENHEAIIGSKVPFHLDNLIAPNHGSFDLRLAKKYIKNTHQIHKDHSHNEESQKDKESHQEHREEENQEEAAQEKTQAKETSERKSIEHKHNRHFGAKYKIVGRMQETGTAWDYAIIVPIHSVWDLHGLTDENHDLSYRLEKNAHHHDEHKHVEEEHVEHKHEGHVAHDQDETHGLRMQATPIIVAKAKSIGQLYKLRSQFDDDKVTAFFPAEIMAELYRVMGEVQQVAELLSLASQMMVACAILIAILIMFKLFDQKFAILRAIGAPQTYIFALIWGYVMSIFISGLAISFITFQLTSDLIQHYLTEQFSFEFIIKLEWQDMVISLQSLFFISLFSIILPWLNSRKSIIPNLAK